MKRTAPFVETLEPRSLLAAVLPAFADQLGLTNKINPTPTFADDFDGTSLDATKWQVRNASRHRIDPNSTNIAWTTPSSVQVSNGELNLIAHNDPVTGQYQSGWIQTAANNRDGSPADSSLVPGSTANFTQAYGYWEARLKFSSVSGMWNAFWVHSFNMPDVGDDPAKANHPEIYGTEMDVVEQSAVRTDAGSGDTVHTTTHANGYASQHISTSAHTNVAALSGSSVSGYHIYGLLWSPTSVTVYIDGRSTYTETNPALVSKVSHMAILSNEIGAPGSNTLGSGHNSWGDVPVGGYGGVDTSTARLTADYVRVWSLNGVIGIPVTPTPTFTPPIILRPKTPAKTRDSIVGDIMPTLGGSVGGGAIGGAVLPSRTRDSVI